MSIALFGALCLCLLMGFPVAFTIAGVSLIFAGIGIVTNTFDPQLLQAYPNRVLGTVTNATLMAVPMFVFMGVILEKAKIAEALLESLGEIWRDIPGGLAISVVLVGTLMAASTGIVGATVVTMGLISLPSMIKQKYAPSLATGVIAATGTLGQIIPPSIALVLLGDVLSTAYQQAQLNQGIYNADTISVGDLFMGAIIPGFILVALYILYIFIKAISDPHCAPPSNQQSTTSKAELIKILLPPLSLIIIVLGSILSGIATPTEAAGVGAIGAMLLAIGNRKLSWTTIKECGQQTASVTAMVFMILMGASLFSLVFRGFGGEELIEHFFTQLPGGAPMAVFVVMVVVFLLGFILDFIEITFVVVPIVGPVLLAMGIDPVWLGIALAINLQTSFLTPPFGFALFYLRGVTPDNISTAEIYRGITPFIFIQLTVLGLISLFPSLATYLPELLK